MTHEDFDASAPDSDPSAASELDSAADSSRDATSLSTKPRFDASEIYDDVADEEGTPSDVVTSEWMSSDEPVSEVSDNSIEAEISSRFQPAGSDEELLELQQPFVGRWNTLVSTTNWEKGRIISQWREALIEAGAPATEYSDEAWASRVGGVTSPHVGRLRRVHDRFGEQAATYDSLYWSHFLAALDWDDAALWLQGAVEEKWSVSKMREQRWKANGELESERPNGSQIIEVDLDEDTPDLGTAPAQGGTNTRDYDGDTAGVAAGPAYEPPDFGDESELAALPEGNHMNDANQSDEGGIATEPPMSPLQPFAGLPELPDDMADVIESLKLTVLRHKSAGFAEVKADTIRRYLEAVAMLIES
ncbi:hypothetical protein Pla100_30240 [Neorhodopirellula pilleata]|uniref:Uncharacterized protein n=2 Tax=Neorhodopirellula pilleata TaxID=2714738 RepID=A0A5C6ABU6_9BACT|nr:hypothetical protein Pla100_30240 [Neorhodopirellula pilleata]